MINFMILAYTSESKGISVGHRRDKNCKNKVLPYHPFASDKKPPKEVILAGVISSVLNGLKRLIGSGSAH